MKKYALIAIMSAMITLVCALAGFAWKEKLERERLDSELKAIIGNLRIIASSADQYFIEYNADIVSYNRLIEVDYFKGIYSFRGESYNMTIRRADSHICVEIPGDYRSVCINF